MTLRMASLPLALAFTCFAMFVYICTCFHFVLIGGNLTAQSTLPACRRLLFPLLHAEKGHLRNAVANHGPVSRWQGILFCINCEIISG